MTRVDLDAWKRAADWVRNCDVPEMRVVTADPEEVDALVAELRAARELIGTWRRLGLHLSDDTNHCEGCQALAAYDKAIGEGT